jgi:Tol biopolymer transport system component
MATGTQPFRGDTRISVLSSILRDAPAPVTDQNPGLPRHLGRIIRRCLAKDPEERYQTCQDLRNELVELRKEVDSGAVLPVGVAAPGASARGSRRRLGYALIALGALAVAAVGYLILRPQGQADVHLSPPVQGSFTQLTDQNGEEIFPSLSPDGRMIAYVSRPAGNWDIFVQSVGGHNAVNVTKDSAADDTQPAFSPDGQKIAFRSEREGGGIFVMGVLGDSVIRLTDAGSRPAWSPDGREIAYETESWVVPTGRESTSQIWALNVDTRQKRKISDGDAVQPAWSPHGLRIAYWGLREGGGQRDLWTLPAGGGDPVPVTEDQAIDWNPVWSPDGRFLHFISNRGGNMNIWRVPIDESSGKVLGPFQSITQAATGSARDLKISGDGSRLVYSSTVLLKNLLKYSLDPAEGKVLGEPVWVTRGSEQVFFMDPSPDGEWLAFGLQGKQEDLFVSRTDGSERRQITDDTARDRMPRWSPDGKRIAFYSDRSGSYGIWTVHPDGSGLTQIAGSPGQSLLYPIWSPDGSRMFVTNFGRTESLAFDPARPWNEQKPEILPPSDEPGKRFVPFSWSPDGEKLAGTLSRGADINTGVVIYDLTTRKYRRLTEKGLPPVWFSDNRRLLYGNDRGDALLLDMETGKSRTLLSVAPDRLDLFSLRVTRDARDLYLVRVNTQSDLWMFTLQ